jgi:hypothetical protein
MDPEMRAERYVHVQDAAGAIVDTKEISGKPEQEIEAIVRGLRDERALLNDTSYRIEFETIEVPRDDRLSQYEVLCTHAGKFGNFPRG